MDRWLQAALDYIPSYLDYQVQLAAPSRLRRRRRAERQRDLRARLRLRQPRHRRAADAAASLSRRLAFEELHRGRHHEAARARQAASRRAGRRLCQRACTATSARARIGQLLSHSAGFVRDGLDSGYFLDRQPFFNEQELLADLREPAADDRARHALQIFEPRLWPARPDHRGGDRRALQRLDQARGRRCRRPEGNRARHADRPRRAARERPQLRIPARPPRRDPGKDARACDGAGDRLRQHGGRPRPLLQPAVAELRSEASCRRKAGAR